MRTTKLVLALLLSLLVALTACQPNQGTDATTPATSVGADDDGSDDADATEDADESGDVDATDDSEGSSDDDGY